VYTLLSFLEELQYSSSETLSADPVTLKTNVEGVFAGGDLVSGPADVISAIAAGQEAAISIELYLEGIDLVKGRPAKKRRWKRCQKKEWRGTQERVYPS
jgi:heterodisulfide reductase subunit A-like polyferredoxin